MIDGADDPANEGEGVEVAFGESHAALEVDRPDGHGGCGAEPSPAPQTEALDIIQETEDGRFKLMGMPLSFDGVRPPQRTGSPELGADNDILFGGKPL